MFRACVVLLLTTTVALAADKPPKAPVKPVGTWEREVSGNKLAFTFKADNSMSITLSSGELDIKVQGHYGVTPGGTLFGVMSKVAAKGTDGGPEKGDLFSFKFSVKKDELTISDLKGSKASDEARKIVEGVYTKKEAKKETKKE
jgi:hypothetical protein